MRVRYLPFAAAGLAMLTGAAPEAPELPGWMVGCWEQNAGDRWTEECWTSPRGGIMLGSSRTVVGERVREWEAMQIILDEPQDGGGAVGMAFSVAPNGGKRTTFAWSPSDGPGVTFRNAANDYPQRIHYRREGDLLIAEISLGDGGKPVRWRFSRR